MAHRTGLLLVALNGVGRGAEGAIAQGGDDAVGPVEVLGRHAGGGVLKVGGRGVHVREERYQRVERVGAVCHPLDGAGGLRAVRADLHHRELALAVDADRAVHVAGALIAQLAVRIERGALVVGAQHVLDILDGHLALRLTGPRDVVGGGLVVGVRAVPHLVVRVEEALHVPGARGVVHVVGVGVGAEGIARVERGSVLHREVQMVGFDEFGKVFGTHVRFLVTQSVLKVEFVDTELVRHGHVGLVRHALGNPVMAAHSFQPPDFVGVGEGDAIHLVGAEFLKQRAEALDALACGLDIRQHDGQEVLFADAAGHLGLIALGRRVFHERVGAEHALVGGQGFGGTHRHVRLVDAGLAPNTFLEVRVRHGGVLQRVVRQGDG